MKNKESSGNLSTNSDCSKFSQLHLLALRTRSIPRSKSSVNSDFFYCRTQSSVNSDFFYCRTQSPFHSRVFPLKVRTIDATFLIFVKICPKTFLIFVKICTKTFLIFVIFCYILCVFVHITRVTFHFSS